MTKNSKEREIEAVRQTLREQSLERQREMDNVSNARGYLISPFARSKKSALVMSGLALLSACAVSTLPVFIRYSVAGDIDGLFQYFYPASLRASSAPIILAVMLFVVILLAIGVGSFVIYRFRSDLHFGVEGAIRWSGFGTMFALLVQMQHRLLPSLPTSVEGFLNGAILILSYLFAFKAIPRLQKKKIAA